MCHHLYLYKSIFVVRGAWSRGASTPGTPPPLAPPLDPVLFQVRPPSCYEAFDRHFRVSIDWRQRSLATIFFSQNLYLHYNLLHFITFIHTQHRCRCDKFALLPSGCVCCMTESPTLNNTGVSYDGFLCLAMRATADQQPGLPRGVHKACIEADNYWHAFNVSSHAQPSSYQSLLTTSPVTECCHLAIGD